MKMRKIAAIVLAAAMAVLSLAGCSTEAPAVVATYDGGEISSGVYIFNQITALNTAYNQLINQYNTGSNILNQKIEGVTVEKWVNNNAQEAIKIHAAMNSEAERLGVSADQETLELLKQEMDVTWLTAGSYYDDIGVSQEDALEVAKFNLVADKLFEAYYGEDGEYAVSEEELRAYFEENFRRSMMVVVSLIDTTTGEPLAKEYQDAARESYNIYKEQIANGASILEVALLEMQRVNDMNGITDPIPTMTEQQAEMLYSREGAGYPEGLRDMMFADGVEMNTPLFYEDDQYLIIFDIRETDDKEGATFESYKPTLLSLYKMPEFLEKVNAVAETINFKTSVDLEKAFPVRAILIAQAKGQQQ